MTSGDEKIVERSKTKILRWILVNCAIVAIGLWTLSVDEFISPTRAHIEVTMFHHGLAIVLIVICGLLGALPIKIGIETILENKPGLIFSNAGIVDNSSIASAGLIPWRDITGVGVHDIVVDKSSKRKMLVIQVANPEKYIEVGGAFRRKLNRNNHNNCGSPIVLSTRFLNIGFSDLQRMAGEYFLKYGLRA